MLTNQISLASNLKGSRPIAPNPRRGHYRLLSQRERLEAVDEVMAEEAKVIAKIKQDGPTEAVSSFNLFQTPKDIASVMAGRLGPLDGLRCLEPSAGLGRLFKACTGGEWVLVEHSNDLCRHLYELGVRLINDDFLNCSAFRLEGKFDRILMNPPFARGMDCKHFVHAMGLVRKGGMIVGLCYNGVKQNRVLKPIADTWEVLPSDTFKECGIKVSTVLVTIRV